MVGPNVHTALALSTGVDGRALWAPVRGLVFLSDEIFLGSPRYFSRHQSTALGDGSGIFAISHQICDIPGTAKVGTGNNTKKTGTAEKSTAVLHYRRTKYRQICGIPGTAKVGTGKKRENREPPKKVPPYCNTAEKSTAQLCVPPKRPANTGYRPKRPHFYL